MKDKRYGFTLIEIIVVVIIVGILAALAIPRYRRSMERMYIAEAKGILFSAYAGYNRLVIDGETFSGAHPITWEACGFPGDPSAQANSRFNYVFRPSANDPNWVRATLKTDASKIVGVNLSTGEINKTGF